MLKLAWRNLWRNRKRTLITVSSVFFAVLLALFMRSMQLGSYSRMIQNSVEMFTGYIQINTPGFRDSKSSDDWFADSEELKKAFAATENVELVLPRLETFALAAGPERSRGAMVVGIAPEIETEMTDLAGKISKGNYLKAGDEGVLIGEGLAEYLKIGVGDTLVLIGQGYQGNSAEGLFPVRGIFRMPGNSLSKSLVYMDLRTCQNLTSAEGIISSYALKLGQSDEMKITAASIKKLAGENLEVSDWEEIMPEMAAMIEADNAGGLVMLGILYTVIGFGIFGTVMMMTIERRREFGVLTAVGMQKSRLIILVILEMLMMGLTGVASAIIVAFPGLLYLHFNPIPLSGEMADYMESFGMEAVIPFSMEPAVFLSQGLAVFVITAVCIWYPIGVIARLKVIKALRS